MPDTHATCRAIVAVHGSPNTDPLPGRASYRHNHNYSGTDRYNATGEQVDIIARKASPDAFKPAEQVTINKNGKVGSWGPATHIDDMPAFVATKSLVRETGPLNKNAGVRPEIDSDSKFVTDENGRKLGAANQGVDSLWC